MDGIELPVTRYALSGDVSIAYQVMGDGSVDIILIPGFMSHIEFQHELAGWTTFLRRLSKCHSEFDFKFPDQSRRRTGRGRQPDDVDATHKLNKLPHAANRIAEHVQRAGFSSHLLFRQLQDIAPVAADSV